MWVTFLQCCPSCMLADVDPEPRGSRDLHRGTVVEISGDRLSRLVTQSWFVRLSSREELEARYFASSSSSSSPVHFVTRVICDGVLA